jgi:hypothetical protein
MHEIFAQISLFVLELGALLLLVMALAGLIIREYRRIQRLFVPKNAASLREPAKLLLIQNERCQNCPFRAFTDDVSNS